MKKIILIFIALSAIYAQSSALDLYEQSQKDVS